MKAKNKSITQLLNEARIRLMKSAVRMGFLCARLAEPEVKPDPKWAEVKRAIRAHHLDALREKRIGIMAALENPLKRSY